tara:strand:+ start:945 stop:1439 length:495 start_codon:yes stop_codon:yes gene_type:complete
VSKLDKINSLDKTEFINFFGNIFEKSEWIADFVFNEKPFKNFEDLKTSFISRFDKTNSEEILKILNSHPELVVESNLTKDSKKEQQGANLNRCSNQEYQEFKKLNHLYRKKFGFPFIIAVKGKNIHEILVNFKNRINQNKEEEFKEAKEQVKQIASIRLDKIFL